MLQFFIIPVVSALLVLAWNFFNWVWLTPRKMEKVFREQGMQGSPYKFLYGDSKDADAMYEKSMSKPIGLNDDTVPRLMPNILDAIKKYGSFSFIWSGPRPRVFITESTHIKELTTRYRTFVKSYKVSNHINQMLVTGLAFKEGDEWAKARARLNPAFHMEKLKRMMPAVQACGEEILNKWERITSKGGGSFEIEVTEDLEVFTSSVLAELMFSLPYTDKIKETFFQLRELASLGKLARYSAILPGEKYLPTKTNRRAKEIDKFARVQFTSMINERLGKRKLGGGGEAVKRDLLDIFMEELYEGASLPEKERNRIVEDVLGNCKIFFFGGFETSSNALKWTMITLSAHQDWQNRAREEVFRVVGDRKDITSDDLLKMKIITMIVNEILRLYPAGMEFSRVVDEDAKLGEYKIPKGTQLTCPTLILHRSKEIWGDDVLEFNPGRFAEGAAKATTRENGYMPFGWGPRMCVASNLALLEIKLFIAMLVRSFSFELSPSYVHAPYVDFTIYPQHGAPLILKKL